MAQTSFTVVKNALRLSWVNVTGTPVPRIDIHPPQEHFGTSMQFLLRHLLLLGVILGLAGQSVAFASSPCAEMQKEQTMSGPMADMPDCAMGQGKTNKDSVPCKDMKLGCFAMAGCASLAVLDAPSIAVRSPLTLAAAALWPPTPILIGRDTAPDPDPPSHLG